MKFLNVLFFFSIGLNIYFLTREDEKSVEQIEDKVSFSKSAIQRSHSKRVKKSLPLKSTTENKYKKERSPEYSDRRDESYEREEFADDFEEVVTPAMIQSEWNAEVQDYFEYELNLSPSEVSEYSHLAKEREGQIQAYIVELTKGRGEEGAKYFAMTMEEMMGLGDINKTYLDELARIIGPENFRAYQNFKREYNSALSGSGQEGQYYVDF